MVSTVTHKRLGWLKATGVGMGCFAYLPEIGRIDHVLKPLYFDAWRMVLSKQGHLFPLIGFIEFPPFDFCPPWKEDAFHGIQVLRGVKRDVLYWTGEEASRYVCGALNPADGFSVPGNEFAYQSVEAMIGNNTDLQVTQNFVHNAHVLDPDHHIPVMVPIDVDTIVKQ